MTGRPWTSTYRVGRAFLAAVTGVACAMALAVAPASAGTDDAADGRSGALPRLHGSVGPGFVISLDEGSVPAGRYKLIVRDKGTIHNFHFFGAGVDRKTSVPGTGKEAWKVTLSPGTYKIRCDPHSDEMKDRLTVT